jgi:diadenosine tetraphosphate (Ap4A) HIT family hydrolase
MEGLRDGSRRVPLLHAFNASLEGWLVVLPRRHVESLAALEQAEAAELGGLLHAVSAALVEVCGCVKTYVLLLAEAEGFPHVHFHVVPRAADLPAEYRGARIFALLGHDAPPQVADARKDELAVALRAPLARLGYRCD